MKTYVIILSALIYASCASAMDQRPSEFDATTIAMRALGVHTATIAPYKDPVTGHFCYINPQTFQLFVLRPECVVLTRRDSQKN